MACITPQVAMKKLCVVVQYNTKVLLQVKLLEQLYQISDMCLVYLIWSGGA